jgi:AcrR family transcriptional regulator
MRKRLAPTVRHEQIIASAVKLAKRVGLANITRDNVAKEAKVSTGLVSKYGDMTDLRAEVVRVAVSDKILPIVAQALSIDHPGVRNASATLKNAALKSLAA